MFPRNNVSLVRISSGFSPQARMISLSWSGMGSSATFKFVRRHKSVYVVYENSRVNSVFSLNVSVSGWVQGLFCVFG